MSKTMAWLLCLIIVTSVVSSAYAGTWTNKEPDDDRWDVPGNWAANMLPFDDEPVWINTGVPGPLVDDTVDGVGGLTRMGGNNTTEYLTITGGSLTLSDHLILGQGTGSDNYVNMSEGTLNGTNLWVGLNGRGTFTITGGTVNLSGTYFSPRLSGNIPGRSYLNGGVVNAAALSFQEAAAFVDITEGKLVLDGDDTGTIQSYIDSGQLRAYSGRGQIAYDYDVTNAGKTTVVAIADPAVLGKAWQPRPVDGAPGVPSDAVLEWNAGDSAGSHDVYFGTSEDPPLVGNQASTTFDPPGELEPGATYYWRVDEINGADKWQGDVWSFTVLDPFQASKPDPGNGAAAVALDSVLSWTPGDGAVSHNVYLGTERDGLVLVSEGQTESTYAPHTLLSGDTYYWQVDEFDGSELHPGVSWSFSTVGPPASLRWTSIDPCDSLWSNPMNWNPADLPGLGTSLTISGHTEENSPVIDANTVAGSGIIRMTDASILVTGGSFYCNSRIVMGQGEGNSVIKISDGAVTFKDDIWVGFSGEGIIEMTGGRLQAGTNLWIPRGINDGAGHVELTDGLIEARDLAMRPDGGAAGTMNIEQGELFLEGDKRAAISNYTADGWLTGYDTRAVGYEYDGNRTRVYADLDLLHFAGNSSPRDFEAIVFDSLDTDVTLAWAPGDTAERRTVYFGETMADVNESATPVSELQTKTSYGPVTLDIGKTYYWRVDEVDQTDPCTYTGRIWTFQTTYINVEDFEEYVTVTDMENDKWQIVANALLYIDPEVTHAGSDISALIDYDNDYPGLAGYSEIGKTLDAAQDWTSKAVTTLTLWFAGDPNNTAEQLYVAIEDSEGDAGVVLYRDEEGALDPEAVVGPVGAWKQWNINLAEFAANNPNVDLSKVRRYFIGLGDRVNPQPHDTAGLVNIDNLRLQRIVEEPDEAAN